MEDNSLGDPLYFIYAIQRSPYGFNLKWKHIKPLISYMFGDEIFEKLKDGRVISTYADDNILEIINIPNIRYNISDSEKEILFHKFIDYVSGHSLIIGLMKIMYLDRKFAQFLMDLLNQNPQKTSDDFINSSTFPIVNLPDFYYSNSFADYCKPYIESFTLDMKNLIKYLGREWFIKLAIILRDGSFNNNSFSKSIENNGYESISGVKELIENDYLSQIIVNLDSFLNDRTVNRALMTYASRSVRERGIKRFYDWLSIANDIMVGLEFVIGSIFFLPSESKYSTLGVYLFIIGSTQLLIRPMINIARRIHIFILHKNA
ncbi:MAG: YrhK family protein [Candidatus Thermoplasmatota archaeon]|nr:YrhK family protein [Candidatus Thermoplasmatota archaeon]